MFFLFVGLVSCTKEVSLKFAKEEIEIVVGEEKELDLTVVGEDVILEWTSSDFSIATVDQDGKVVGVKVGEVTITVTAKDTDAKATITVIVKAKPEVVPTGVIVMNIPDEVKVGDVVTLSVTVLPEGASQEVVWSSSNPAVATVDATGKVSFLAVGEVVITAASKAKLTVKRDVPFSVQIPDPTEVVISSKTGLYEVLLSATLQMEATVHPDLADQTVIWSVNDSNIATITEAGLLQPKQVGTVIVSATSAVDDEVFGTKTITILRPPGTSLELTAPYKVLQIEEEMQLVTRILPELADQEVIFASTNSDVLTVDSTGKVVAVAVGTATITATAKTNPNVGKAVLVTVVEKVAEVDHDNYYVSAGVKNLSRYEKFVHDSEDYYVGINAFADFDEIDSLEEGTTIFVGEGIYIGSLVINKDNVSIISENELKDPNKVVFEKQAVLQGKFTLAADVKNVRFAGLSFTNTGRIENVSTLDGFTFENNFIYATQPAGKVWAPGRDYNLTGFITLWKMQQKVDNIVIENNKFENVPEVVIMIGNTDGVSIKNNTFTNFGQDAIRMDGGHNYNETTITGNRFVNDEVSGTNAIYFRSLGVNATADNRHMIEIADNYFENIGTDQDYSGAISAQGYQEWGVTINIHHNEFVSCYDYIWLRNNATAANHAANSWVANINFNVFLGLPENYYFRSKNGTTDTEETNPTLANLDANFFGDLDGNQIDLTDEDILALFIDVASLNYSFTSIEAMTALFVDLAWEGKADQEEILYDGMLLSYGKTAFSKIMDALEAVEPRGIIIVLPGEYDEEVEITKPVNMMTLNSNFNPVEDDSRFLDLAETSTVITKVWYLNNVSNVTIKGFTFTGEARVRQYGAENSAGLRGFVFENNYAHDTNAPTIAWKQTAYASYGISTKYDTTMPGFLSLAQFASWMYDFKIINNKFSNVLDTNIVLICTSGVTITGNEFIGSDRDAIRVDYSTVHGVFNIKNNHFEDIKYNGFYVRSYVVAHSPIVFNIEGNVFKNIGEAGKTETPASTRIGAIATAGYGETNSATFNIRFNHFEDNVNYITLRANVTDVDTWATKPHEWKAIIEYNSFIDADEVTNYFINAANAADTAQTNVNNVVFDNNFYGKDADTKADILPSQFDIYDEENSNLTVYETLEELLEAIATYNEFIKPIYVDPALADLEDDDPVMYNGIELKYGVSAFSNLADAVDAAEAGKIIILAPGLHQAGNVNVVVDNLTLVGPNKGINPITGTRAEEAIIEAKVIIGEGVKNFEVNGITLNYKNTGSYFIAHANGKMDGFKFLYNIIEGSQGGGDAAPLRFFQGSAAVGNKNFNISFNIIRNVGADRGIRIAHIENFHVEGNLFEKLTTDAIRLNDNSGSVTGEFYLINNTFKDIGQFAVFQGATSIEKMVFTGNTFDNMGTHYSGGALSIRALTLPAAGTEILIANNTFKDSQSAIRIDHALAAQAANIVIENNEFFATYAYIYNNTLAGEVSTLFKLNNKVYDAGGELLDLEELTTGASPMIKNAFVGDAFE